jgi:N-methylhydantoinase A
MTRSGAVIGVDTGGTFTDFVLMDGDSLRIHKVPSTAENPARAVLRGLVEVLGEDDGGPEGVGSAVGSEVRNAVRSAVQSVVHGSTVATNTLLERRGARVVLITTAGFEDVIEIGRQTRTAIYDLNVEKAAPLVPAERRLGAHERVGPQGEVVEPLDDSEIDRLLDLFESCEAESAAICLLHAYANPEHERRLVEAVRERSDLHISASHEVLPEFREFERCSTTVVNAFVGPVMSGYLAELADALGRDRVRIMQSNGGALSLEAAGRLAVQTILSGPAGGAVGGFEIGRRAGSENVITFDMGGTSTDVSLCPGGLTHTADAMIGGLPIRVPVVDIHTVGAGGGSIAYRDPGGSLKVGPRSAGADPGPICYGHGGSAITVTDANLFLGRLSPEHFLGGEQRLDAEPLGTAMEQLGVELGLSAEESAEGVLRVVNATMERAIRVISLERGFDPRDFTLVCFGGAGAMHAADLARSLGIPRVLVPRGAGTLSAHGMLLADVVRDFSQTLLRPCAELAGGALEETFERLIERGRRALSSEGFGEEQMRLERSVDARYVGQGYELNIPHGREIEAAFHEQHEARYGYADPTREVEVVNVRLRAVGITEKPTIAEEEPGDEDASAAVLGEHRMICEGSGHTGVLVDRERLEPGNAFAGPALVVEYSTTTVVPPGARCRVDRFGNLILEWE